MPAHKEFQQVFEQLRDVLEKYERRLILQADTPDNYSLDTPFSARYKKTLFFGAVRINKSYVSYHLMPVYVFPELLQGISPELKARMQGKSCFNFKTIEVSQVKELAWLTQAGFKRFKQGKLV